MKKIMSKTIIFFVLWASTVNAEDLTVFIKSGLVLRDGPRVDAKKILVIPYGTTISVSPAKESSTHTSEGIVASFVSTEYEGKQGYVFFGYLSKFPACPPGVTSVRQYLEKKFGPGKKQKLKANEENAETQKFIVRLKDGIEIDTTIYLGGGYSTITLPEKYEIREVFLLFKAIEKNFSKIHFNQENPNLYKVKVWLNGEGGAEETVDIEKKNGQLSVVSGGQT